MGCRVIAGRLFVPTDAVVHPPITDAELVAICPLPVAFFHPAFGLSGFDEESTLRVWNLIEMPEEREENWNFARPGAAGLPELRAILLAPPPSIDDVFGGAEQDIGSEPIIDLPPAPDELKEDAWSKLRGNLRRLFARGVAGAVSQIPHTASRRTWANKLEDWANRQMRGVNEQLDRIRNKELHRLLRMLETDPEAGLRHAIPMNSFAHRGLAPPGGRLGSRSLNFDPSRLGGRAADFWNVPIDLQEVLRRRYREMADRELQLGRHRRAAYVYAELLGDLVSAASALKQGRHFREAALLYEEHLKNPLEAARCLADGGLLMEAIDRYEKLGRWLDVADLHERLGNHAAAEEALRRVVSDRITQDDILGAAKLVDERLRAPDEALGLLLGAWPASRQAAGCVTAAFHLLGRMGRHDVALERIAQFRREPLPRRMVLPLLAALGGLARDYPHEQVRHRAADFSRVLIAKQLDLPALPPEETSQLMESLIRLAPQDRLLARDANRHLSERRSNEMRARRVTPPPMPGHKPAVLRRFELPRQIEWLQLRREWHWFFAAGVTPQRLTLVRGVWEGEIQSVSWDWRAQFPRSGLVFEPTGERGVAVAFATSTGLPLPQKRFPAADMFFNQECVVGTPPWLSLHAWPVAFGEESVWSMRIVDARAILSCLDKRGKLQRTIDVTEDLLNGADRGASAHLCVAAVSNGAAVALGNRLVLTRGDGGLIRVELPGQATGLVATLPHTRQGVVALLEHGATMLWQGADGLIELDRDLASPMGTFVPGGPLVLISDSRMQLLDVDSNGVQKVTRVELAGKAPVGVSATASPGQFATLDGGGQMTVYSVPR